MRGWSRWPALLRLAGPCLRGCSTLCGGRDPARVAPRAEVVPSMRLIARRAVWSSCVPSRLPSIEIPEMRPRATDVLGHVRQLSLQGDDLHHDHRLAFTMATEHAHIDRNVLRLRRKCSFVSGELAVLRVADS